MYIRGDNSEVRVMGVDIVKQDTEVLSGLGERIVPLAERDWGRVFPVAIADEESRC